jgi:hypothetical protein
MPFLQQSIDAGVIPNCNCGKPCGANRQNKKGPNQYRWFFCCRAGEMYQKCGFFQWIPDNKKIVGCNLVDKE